MEYLQYRVSYVAVIDERFCFKPCYKWNTFNTEANIKYVWRVLRVLNLVISGIPSIHCNDDYDYYSRVLRF